MLVSIAGCYKAICEGYRDYDSLCQLFYGNTPECVAHVLRHLVRRKRIFTACGVLFRHTPFEEYRWN